MSNITFIENNENPPHATPEMAALIAEMGKYLLMENKHEGKKKILLFRRKLRNRLFRIRDCLSKNMDASEWDNGLKAWIELQFDKSMSWYKKNKKGEIIGGFSFEWDVSSKEPLKVISRFEWDGEIDQVLYQRGGEKKCVPPAFTEQA